jgi:hypothetical protein
VSWIDPIISLEHLYLSLLSYITLCLSTGMLLVITCTGERHFRSIDNTWRSWRGTNIKQKSETLMAVMPTTCGTCFSSLHITEDCTVIHTFQDYQRNHTHSSKKCMQNHRIYKEVCMVTYATRTIFNAWFFVQLKGEKKDPSDSHHKTESCTPFWSIVSTKVH